MIYLQNQYWKIDLSGKGVDFREESSLFSDDINKSYSLPFNIEGDNDLIRKLGLPTSNNIQKVNTNVKCRLVMPNRSYPARLHIGVIKNSNIECVITYGPAEITVLDTKLKNLPWPKIITSNLSQYAKDTITKSWPETAFNFPMLYYPDIGKDDTYEYFKGFINNYEAGTFKENYVDQSGGENKYINQNLMTPFPYLLEILRFGFSIENKQVIGQLFENKVLKQTVYIPENYLEKFKGSDYQSFSFTNNTIVDASGSVNLNIYRREINLNDIGNYKVNFKLNIPPNYASIFYLKIAKIDVLSQEENIIQEYDSRNTRVQLEEELSIEVENFSQYDTVLIEMHLQQTDANISKYNNFEFSKSDGKLSVFPNVFSLSNFMPDMTFGEYLNQLKNWLNLDIKIRENYVKIDFAQEVFRSIQQRDHSHLEVPNPDRKINLGRFFELNYANGKQVFYDRNGQVFSDLSNDSDDAQKIEMDVQPLKVESNKNIITAVFPKNKSKIDFAVYTGIIDGKPRFDRLATQELSLQNVLNKFWKKWLYFRVYSESFKESFDCSTYEQINIEENSFKYNQLHLMKKIKKKYKSEKTIEVEIETETL